MKKNRKKTLLLVTHGLVPESLGGVEVYTRHLYDAFKESEKIQPAVLTRTRNNRHLEGVVFGDEADPYLFYIYTKHMDMASLRAGGGYEDGFKDFLVSLKPDIIHFQHFLHLSLDWFKSVREVLPHAKIVLTLHEYLLLCPHNGQMILMGRSPDGARDGHLCHNAFSEDCRKCFPFWSQATLSGRREYVKDSLKAVDRIIVPSHFSRKIMMEKLNIPERKILFSENGQKGFQLAAPEKRQEGLLTLGFLGQINQYKGLHVLLEAMEKIEGVHDIRLKIYGGCTPGPGEAYFNQTIKPCLERLTQVEYAGAYMPDQVATLLSGLDALVVPSIWWENSPLVIQEAFLAKVPVICSNIGGMAEKVSDGVNGLHFAVNDSQDLFKKILAIYENREKLDLFRKNIPRVKAISENMSELEDIYLSL